MQVKIIALTSKAEEALRKYIQDSQDRETEMSSLSSLNPRRIRFNIEQKAAKKIIGEEYFENPLMIVATIKPKFSSQAYIFIPKIEQSLVKIMENSGCGLNDYSLETS